MKVDDVVSVVEGRVLCRGQENEIQYGFSSDLMSDVLTLSLDNVILITGLVNMQTIRTAEMANVHTIILARGKKATPIMIDAAKEIGITLIETNFSLFRIASELAKKGIKPCY